MKKNSFSSKKCLVIGANSFLGAELIQQLKTNNDVTGVYHQNTDKLIDDIKNISINSIDDLQDDYDTVFIISAYISGKDTPKDVLLLNQVNVDLPKMICGKFKHAKIIYASSVSVYSDNLSLIDERSETQPKSAYGKSKLLGEKTVSEHFSFSIIRISSMYGDGMNGNTFLPKIVKSALESKKIEIFGNGNRLQNYIHVSDVAEIFIRTSQLKSNYTYLAVGKKSYSNIEIAEIIKKQLSDIEIEFVGEDNSASYNYDGRETYSKLNIEPQVNLYEGIKELI